MPLLIYSCVVIGIVASLDAHRRSRKRAGKQPNDRRLKQVCMQYVNAVAAQESSKREQAKSILSPALRIATETIDALRLHVIAKPPSHRIKRGKKHLVATSVMPACKLRKEPAGIAVLRKVQYALFCLSCGNHIKEGNQCLTEESPTSLELFMSGCIARCTSLDE